MTVSTESPTPTMGGDATLKLREYQIEAVTFLREHPRSVLMLDMGLG